MVRKKEITDTEFNKLSDMVYDFCGIMLSSDKKVFVERKLNKRLATLGIESYREYFEFLYSQEGMQDEFNLLINVLTTNKTDFFREPAHFDFLKKTVISEFILKNKLNHTETFEIWSAGCSTGEEPYTMAIVLSELKEENSYFRFNIHASDISTEVLETAYKGIYKAEITDVIPKSLKVKYLMRSKDPSRNVVRFIPEIRALINLYQINLLEGRFHLPGLMDVIFCRNVLIYFDRETQLKVLTNLTRQLKPFGYLFIGHSETIAEKKLPLERVAPTIYRRIN